MSDLSKKPQHTPVAKPERNPNHANESKQAADSNRSLQGGFAWAIAGVLVGCLAIREVSDAVNYGVMLTVLAGMKSLLHFADDTRKTGLLLLKWREILRDAACGLLFVATFPSTYAIVGIRNSQEIPVGLATIIFGISVGCFLGWMRRLNSDSTTARLPWSRGKRDKVLFAIVMVLLQDVFIIGLITRRAPLSVLSLGILCSLTALQFWLSLKAIFIMFPMSEPMRRFPIPQLERINWSVTTAIPCFGAAAWANPLMATNRAKYWVYFIYSFLWPFVPLSLGDTFSEAIAWMIMILLWSGTVFVAQSNYETIAAEIELYNSIIDDANNNGSSQEQ